jgi:hypothetical protein
MSPKCALHVAEVLSTLAHFMLESIFRNEQLFLPYYGLQVVCRLEIVELRIEV